MKQIKYIGTVSPWVDTLGGSGLTWTTNQVATVSDDVCAELIGYPALFVFVADASGVTSTTSIINALQNPASAGDLPAIQSLVSGDCVRVTESGDFLFPDSSVYSRIVSSTWAARPLTRAGIVRITDVGVGGSLWMSNGSGGYTPLGAITLLSYCSNGSDTVTGTTSYVDVASVALPAGVLIGRSLSFDFGLNCNNNANVKSLEVRANGATVTKQDATTSGGTYFSVGVIAKDAGALRALAYGNVTGSAYAGASNLNLSINLQQEVVLAYSIKLANSADSATMWMGRIILM